MGNFLLSLGYQVLKFYSPIRFRKFLQDGTLSGDEWLPPNQARRLSNLQHSSFWGLEVQVFPDSYGELGINRYSMAVLMSVAYRVRNFKGRHGYWRLVHHHRVGVVTIAAAWVGLGAAFGNLYMEAILSCIFLRT